MIQFLTVGALTPRIFANAKELPDSGKRSSLLESI
jgi:hypothetical protein